MATHSSPGACGPQSMGLQRVGHDLVTEHTHTHINENKWKEKNQNVNGR